MRILIPMADGYPLCDATIKSIARQTVPCDIYTVSRPKPHASDLGLIRNSEAANRNLLKKYATPSYVFYMDPDVVFTSDHDVEDCMKFLDESVSYDAVALDTKGGLHPHVCIACFCVRESSLKGYVFTGDHDHCCCLDLNKKMKIKYLDSRLLKEIDRRTVC